MRCAARTLLPIRSANRELSGESREENFAILAAGYPRPQLGLLSTFSERSAPPHPRPLSREGRGEKGKRRERTVTGRRMRLSHSGCAAESQIRCAAWSHPVTPPERTLVRRLVARRRARRALCISSPLSPPRIGIYTSTRCRRTKFQFVAPATEARRGCTGNC